MLLGITAAVNFAVMADEATPFANCSHKFVWSLGAAATTAEDGFTEYKCSVCGYVKETKTIDAPVDMKLGRTSYSYTGKDIGPGVTVKDKNGKTLKYKTDYKLVYDKGRTNVGTYAVTIHFMGDYAGSQTLYFDITPMNSDDCTAKLSSNSYYYTGKDIGPGVSIVDKNNRKLIYRTDYTLTYDKGRTDPGKYAIVVNYMGNYSGSETLYFNINEIPADKCTAKPSAWSYYYTGKDIGPGVSVTDFKGRKLVYKKDYTLTYDEGRTDVGRYSIKVNYINGYKGSKTIYFYIIPKQTYIVSLLPISQGFTVQWKNYWAELSGYQVQYSQYSNFSNSRTVTLSDVNEYSLRRTKMGINKNYYVRIRTYKEVIVDGKQTTLFSGWSSVKTVKTAANMHSCSNNATHYAVCGNMGKWFDTKEEVIEYAENEAMDWTAKYLYNEITARQYVENCPKGYQGWRCPYCGKWSGDFTW